MTDKELFQYFCKRCGYERKGLLDHEAPGVGAYAWACPECGSHDIDSKRVTDSASE